MTVYRLDLTFDPNSLLYTEFEGDVYRTPISNWLYRDGKILTKGKNRAQTFSPGNTISLRVALQSPTPSKVVPTKAIFHFTQESPHRQDYGPNPFGTSSPEVSYKLIQAPGQTYWVPDQPPATLTQALHPAKKQKEVEWSFYLVVEMSDEPPGLFDPEMIVDDNN